MFDQLARSVICDAKHIQYLMQCHQRFGGLASNWSRFASLRKPASKDVMHLDAQSGGAGRSFDRTAVDERNGVARVERIAGSSARAAGDV